MVRTARLSTVGGRGMALGVYNLGEDGYGHGGRLFQRGMSTTPCPPPNMNKHV